MLWIHLSIFRSVIVALLILSLRYDSTPYFMLPIIVNVIVGVISTLYFIFYYTEHFTNEFVKPMYYLYAIIFLLMNLLGFYIIKVCPNPAYFRVFISLQIILLFLITLYVMEKEKEKEKEAIGVSTQSMAGLLFGCLAIILISLDEANHK
jgi:hypothetical protein